MTQQSGSYRYDTDAARQQAERVTDQAVEGGKAAMDRAAELGQDALDQVDEWLKPTGLSIKERPMTVLAIVGGLAFAAGAVWMLRPTRKQAYAADLMSQLSGYARHARRNVGL